MFYGIYFVQLRIAKDTFAEAVRNERYLKNECFINSLYDFYGDKLLDPRQGSGGMRIPRRTS
jgi:hypothetical protein